MVPGSTLMYGSSLMLVTRMLRDSRIAARDAAAMPFPNEETTPPVTKTYLAIYLSRGEIRKFTGFFFLSLKIAPARRSRACDFTASSIHVHPLGLDPVVGAMHHADVFPHRPRNHLAVQRHVVDLGVVLGKRLRDELLALCGIGLDVLPVDQPVELLFALPPPVPVALALAVGAVQHRPEDGVGGGDGAAPAQQVGAGVAFRHARAEN